MKKLYNVLGFAAIVGIFLSIGSIGVYMNWSNPSWAEFGVNPAELRSSIQNFPAKHCSKEVRPVCEHMSNGTLWFLGL